MSAEERMQKVLRELLDAEIEACAELAEKLEFSTPDEIAFAIRLRKSK